MSKSKHYLNFLPAVALIVALLAGGIVLPAGRALAAAGLQLAATPAAPGDTITVTGTGFRPRADVLLRVPLVVYGRHLQRSTVARTNDTGSFTGRLNIPQGTKPDGYTVTAADRFNDAVSSTLTVDPIVRLVAGTSTVRSISNPNGGVLVAGRGYQAGETVRITVQVPLANGGMQAITKDLVANSAGVLPRALITIPAGSANGPSSFQAQGLTSGRKAVVQVKLGTAPASISIAPGTTAAAQEVVVTGYHFNPGAAIQISGTFQLTTGGSQTVYATVTTNGNGAFSAPLQVPDKVVPGNVTVKATGPAHSAQGTLHIKTYAVSAQVQPNPAHAGQTVTVTGSGFSAGVPITVTATFPTSSGSQAVSASTHASNVGAYAVVLPVPANASSGNVTVSVHGPNASTNSTIAVQAANIPTTLTVQPASARPGQTITVKGSGFAANSSIQVFANFPLTSGQTQVVRSTVTSNGSGEFTGSFNVPSGTAPSTISVYAAGPRHQTMASLAVLPSAASISVQPTIAHPGDTLTVNGQGFSPNAAITVYATYPSGNGSSLSTSVRVTSSGTGSFSARLGVPNQSLTANALVVAQGPSLQARAAIVVQAAKASLQVGSGSARQGQKVTLSGQGFGPGVNVTISATFPVSGGNHIFSTTVRTNGNGQFSTTVDIPSNAVSSTVSISAQGPHASASTHLSVAALSPQVSLQPASVRPGGTVQVSGNGYTPNTNLTISVQFALQGGGYRTVSAGARSDAYGNYRANLSVPANVAAGSATVVVSGPHTRASKLLSISKLGSAIAVSPGSVTPGSSVAITGSGFLSGARVDISFTIKDRNGAQHTLAQTVTTGSNGSFRAQFNLPASTAGGAYTVSAKSESSGRIRTATLNVSHLNPSIVVSPTTVETGNKLTVAGFGYAPRQTITLTLNGHTLSTVTTDSNGRFSVSLTVPAGLASGSYPLQAQSSQGRQASAKLNVNRAVSTHYYFASLYTGHGYHEYLTFLNPTNIAAHATITYQRTTGVNSSKTITVQAHSRFTEDVNADLGTHVSAAAKVDADVPIAASRMVYHNYDGAVVPGGAQPGRTWYFANGNTGHGYREYLAIQNPNTSPVQVALHFMPTHRAPFTVYRTVNATSRLTVKVNTYVKRDAVGVMATSNGPVVINRSIFKSRGMTSKIGASAPSRNWYFAAGPQDTRSHNWLGVINPNNKWSYITVRAFGPLGALRGQQHRWLRPYARAGILINKLAGMTDAAVQVTASRPIVAEQTTYIGRLHQQSTDTFGTITAHKAWAFAAVNTIPGQSDTLDLFNPTSSPVPVVVQFMRANGQTMSRSYVVNPMWHERINVGAIAPNAYLGVVINSDHTFVAMNRLTVANGNGSMTSKGVPMG